MQGKGKEAAGFKKHLKLPTGKHLLAYVGNSAEWIICLSHSMEHSFLFIDTRLSSFIVTVLEE